MSEMLHKVTWIEGIQPTPRKERSGSGRGMAHPQEALYKEAIADGLRRIYPGIEPLDEGTEIALTFYLARKMEQGDKVADATNMQKLTEDALHGVLYHDDKWTRRITTETWQSPDLDRDLIGIRVELFKPDPDGFAAFVAIDRGAIPLSDLVHVVPIEKTNTSNYQPPNEDQFFN